MWWGWMHPPGRLTLSSALPFFDKKRQSPGTPLQNTQTQIPTQRSETTKMETNLKPNSQKKSIGPPTFLPKIKRTTRVSTPGVDLSPPSAPQVLPEEKVIPPNSNGDLLDPIVAPNTSISNLDQPQIGVNLVVAQQQEPTTFQTPTVLTGDPKPTSQIQNRSFKIDTEAFEKRWRLWKTPEQQKEQNFNHDYFSKFFKEFTNLNDIEKEQKFRDYFLKQQNFIPQYVITSSSTTEEEKQTDAILQDVQTLQKQENEGLFLQIASEIVKYMNSKYKMA
jgi:hypothetical protein